MPNGKNGNRKLAREAQAVASTARRIAQNATYTRPFRQGVGRTPCASFGSKPVKRNGRKTPNGARYFSALNPAHLPLPRAIGPYAVIRTTSKHKVDNVLSIWGPTMVRDPNGRKEWTNIVGVADSIVGDPMNNPNNTQIYTDEAFGTFGATKDGWQNCTLVPAAFTVQIMNPSSVMNAKGIAYIGKLKTLSDLAGNARTWSTFGGQFISYNYPRLCSGGKLALRGVTSSTVPYDMSDLAEFTPIEPFTNLATMTWDGSSGLSGLEHSGFAPIMIYQTDFTEALEVLVTVEWRVRFDPSNPAQASHKLYKPSTDMQWAAHVASESVRGVEDIAEFVADLGVDAAAIGAVAAVMA